jgi:hypothetical protein
MVVLTPSFGPDFELCAGLNSSILEMSPGPVRHQIVVPDRDVSRFRALAGPRTAIVAESDVLPRTFVKAPIVNYTLNLRRPFPPIRGWILQQVLKLGATAAADADVVLLVDSDIEFIRPFTVDTFRSDGIVRLYRKPAEVDERLPRHVRWHQAAHAMLGLPAPTVPMPDYVSSLVAWDPAAVRAMLERVERTTGRPWATVVGAQLHFSEWTLYGVFVDGVLGPPANTNASDESLCHAYWDVTALDATTANDVVRGVQPRDIALMISAKSRTPLPVRRATFTASRGAHRDEPTPVKE